MNSTLIANYSAIYAPANFVYRNNSNVGYDDRHQGQRKLLLTEVQHLNHYLENFDEEAIVIYVGAAPNNKALVYNRLYPNVKFILIDPNPFIIKNPEHLDIRSIVANGENNIQSILRETHNILLFNRCMDMAGATFLNKLIRTANKKIFFWSDVRMNTANRLHPSDVDVIGNHMMVHCWIQKLIENYQGEFYSMLKFRLPYPNANLSSGFLQNYGDYYNMTRHIDFQNTTEFPVYQGQIMLQAYPGKNSTETRLWSNIDDLRSNLRTINISEYDNKLAYYNTVLRRIQYGNSNDILLEEEILYTYFAKFRIDIRRIYRRYFN